MKPVDDYVILLYKEDTIVQIRSLKTTKELALSEAKNINSLSETKFNNVVLYKTIPHFIRKEIK
jgi:hypothetical protein